MTAYRDIWYRSSDGLQLYARDYPCRGGPADATVLCMHGLTRNSADFADLARHLAARYRVISVDQRGRGRSDYDPVPANYTPLTYVQDMFRLLDELSVTEAILVGTSMGGLMSMLMAAMQPQRVRAMVLNDIGPELDPRGLERIKSYAGRLQPVNNWEEAVAQTRLIAGVAYPDFSDGQWQDMARKTFREQDGIPVLAYDPAISQPLADRDSGALPGELWELFAGLPPIPLLLIRGASSDILAPECVDRMREIRPDMRYAEVPRRGHAPTLDEDVSRAAIDDFLQRL